MADDKLTAIADAIIRKCHDCDKATGLVIRDPAPYIINKLEQYAEFQTGALKAENERLRKAITPIFNALKLWEESIINKKARLYFDMRKTTDVMAAVRDARQTLKEASNG